MSNLSSVDFDAGDSPAVTLTLHRYGSEVAGGVAAGRTPVLLLHGASACHRTFTVPGVGLANWLFENRFDPWLLDWRGSHLVVEKNPESLTKRPERYNFNRAAREDLPAAIAKMRDLHVEGRIGLLGHCMGGAVVAEAVAGEYVTNEAIDRVVLIALGLFYEAPIDSRLKAEERILERLTVDRQGVAFINPRGTTSSRMSGWPPDVNNLYEAWPGALRWHEETDDAVPALCNRLSFLFGMPYHHKKLTAAIHGDETVTAQLPEQFGAIPLHMYLHAAKNLRSGQATVFKELTASTVKAAPITTDTDFVSDDSRARFLSLEKLTLITGALNRLWHRDGIDRMYEWLCRGPSLNLRRCQKIILPDYGHQDLLWSDESPTEVYPAIAAGLRDAGDGLTDYRSRSRSDPDSSANAS